MLKLRNPKTGLVIEYDVISCTGKLILNSDLPNLLPSFMRDYQIIKDTSQDRLIEPSCGWGALTLDNFETEMGYRFVMNKDASMRGITREVAFLEFLESKGINRKDRLIENLTLANFQEKTGHRFKRTKEDMDRGLSKERAFEEWKKRNGY